MRSRAALACAGLLGGCVSLPSARNASCPDAPQPEIRVSKDGRTASTTLDVLAYNVEGLPRPVGRGRAASLREIGEHLAALRAKGEAPDVVLFQEIFSRPARHAVLSAGYPDLVRGPGFADRSLPTGRRQKLPGHPNPIRGEIGVKLVSSGLVIATRYPVLAARRWPFARGSCAGLDCLASKGVVLASIILPGVPGPVDLADTHMNSRIESRVNRVRYNAAYGRQVLEIEHFLNYYSRAGRPLVFGGDFNMLDTETRLRAFRRLKGLTAVQDWCLDSGGCEVEPSFDGDAPWKDTEDVQLFRSGALVRIRPLRIEAMFDGARGRRLSDNDGVRVLYELSWPAWATPGEACGNRVRLSSVE